MNDVVEQYDASQPCRVSRAELSALCDGLQRTEQLLRVHYWLRSPVKKPDVIVIPEANTLEAASRLLGWAAAVLSGSACGERPALPDDEALTVLRQDLQRARWS